MVVIGLDMGGREMKNPLNNRTVQKSPEQTFADEYDKLCKQHGLQVVASPFWVVTNHGTFELTMQYSVARLPNTQNAEEKSDAALAA